MFSCGHALPVCQEVPFTSLLFVCLSFPSADILCVGLSPIRLSSVRTYYSGSASSNPAGSDRQR